MEEKGKELFVPVKEFGSRLEVTLAGVLTVTLLPWSEEGRLRIPSLCRLCIWANQAFDIAAAKALCYRRLDTQKLLSCVFPIMP